jgi:integrase
MSVKIIKGYRTWRYKFKYRGVPFRGCTGISIDQPRDKAVAAEGAIMAKKKEETDAAGHATNTVGMRLDAAAARYWKEKGHHYPRREETLRRIVVVLGAKTPLKNITNESVQHLIDARTAKGSEINGKPLKPRTLDHTINLLGRILRRARDTWKVPLPNMPDWKNFKQQKAVRPGRNMKRAITDKDMVAIAQFETPDCRDVRLFTDETGMRMDCEVLSMTWPKVDFENEEVTFTPKGQDEERVMPLSSIALEILKRQRGKHPTAVWTFTSHRNWRRKDKETGALTVYRKGERYPMTYAYFIKRWERDARDKGGVTRTPHGIRHRFAMRQIYEEGIELQTVAGLMGHSSQSITEGNYLEKVPRNVMKAALERGAQRRKQEATDAPTGTVSLNAKRKAV